LTRTCRQTAEMMKALMNPANITFKPYPGLDHSSCPEVGLFILPPP
uniref:Uncharacterized protein n=1 Tax=Cynoglossus semilaevis TaxID=244447 RepID=A0A3P8VB71_CYNSE